MPARDIQWTTLVFECESYLMSLNTVLVGCRRRLWSRNSDLKQKINLPFHYDEHYFFQSVYRWLKAAAHRQRHPYGVRSIIFDTDKMNKIIHAGLELGKHPQTQAMYSFSISPSLNCFVNFHARLELSGIRRTPDTSLSRRFIVMAVGNPWVYLRIWIRVLW